MNGFLFKYQADSSDKFLRDKGPYISDPDFWSNPNGERNNTITPVWAVCGVKHRQRIREGDILFFIPQKSCYPANLNPYCFTGVLVCGKRLDREHLPEGGLFSGGYMKRYEKSFREHYARDKPGTKKIRGKSIIIGKSHPTISRWFGDSPVEVVPLLRKFQLRRQERNLRWWNSAIPALGNQETRLLYDQLMETTSASMGMEAYPPLGGEKVCSSCSH